MSFSSRQKSDRYLVWLLRNFGSGKATYWLVLAFSLSRFESCVRYNLIRNTSSCVRDKYWPIIWVRFHQKTGQFDDYRSGKLHPDKSKHGIPTSHICELISVRNSETNHSRKAWADNKWAHLHSPSVVGLSGENRLENQRWGSETSKEHNQIFRSESGRDWNHANSTEEVCNPKIEVCAKVVF